jgi:hypothetical protein
MATTTVEASATLKRRQSHTPADETEQEADSKRQRTNSGKNSPNIAQHDAAAGSKKEEPSSTESRKASVASDTRRKSSAVDEKGKAKRLFGGLLGSLAQPSDRTSKRRQEIESRRKAELAQQDAARIEDKLKRAERFIEKRKVVRVKVDEENVCLQYCSGYKPWTVLMEGTQTRLRHQTILHKANFLQTTTEPKLVSYCARLA